MVILFTIRKNAFVLKSNGTNEHPRSEEPRKEGWGHPGQKSPRRLSQEDGVQEQFEQAEGNRLAGNGIDPPLFTAWERRQVQREHSVDTLEACGSTAARWGSAGPRLPGAAAPLTVDPHWM